MSEARGETLTDRLTAAERERRWPNLRPKDAASLIILDRRGSEPKVLMGRRHPGHAFMPGKFVFPGGRIDAGDRRMVAAIVSGAFVALVAANFAYIYPVLTDQLLPYRSWLSRMWFRSWI